MASVPDFNLVSAATAIAIIASPKHHSEINKLRSVHDKAYFKWQPHINILYPFVQAPQLDDAVVLLKFAVQESNVGKVSIKIGEVGVFIHRKNATLFLKPDVESEARMGGLRKCLTKALGREENEGTRDGTFRPHLTIGQAGLQGDSMKKLSEKIERLVGLEWECSSLAVLKRKPTGEMELVDTLSLGGESLEEPDLPLETTDWETGWSPCFSFNEISDWETYTQATPIQSLKKKLPKDITIATYNLMVDQLAPPFVDRFPLILEAITSATQSGHGLKVLFLQEVDHTILSLLLNSPQIQKAYPYSTHAPSLAFQNKRNLVTLASEPFNHFIVEFIQRHKFSLITEFLHLDIAMANVHLTSALTDSSVAAKTRQMVTLTDFLQKNARKVGQIFVAGDFNLTTSSQTIETALAKRIITPSTAAAVKSVIDANIWEDAFLKYTNADSPGQQVEKGGGITFDRLNNPLAALSKGPVDNRPQRYDRILWAKNKEFLVEVDYVENFGFLNEGGECGSDHYGVCASLSISSGFVETVSMRHKGERTGGVVLVSDEMDLKALLRPYMPNKADKAQRLSAIEALQETLDGDVVFAPLGSYATDTYFPESDIDLLVIGTVAPQIFFEAAQEQLETLRLEASGEGSPEDGIKGLHFVNSLVPIIEIVVRGIKVDLQYCQAPELVQRLNTTIPQPDLCTLVFDEDIISTLSPTSLRPLNTYRDTAYLLNTIPNLPSYRLAHRFLSLYLKRRGLYSAKFGYLGGIHLSLLLNKIVKSLHASASGASIVRSFFSYYATFNWASEIVADPAASRERISRSAREAIVIQSIHTPTARPNVASSCTKLSAQVISEEFAFAVGTIQEGNWEWCLRPKKDSVSDFLWGYGGFVKITLDIWNLNEIGPEKAREVTGGLESKITALMVSLGRVDGLKGRVWPERFAEVSSLQEEDGDQVKAIYLVGISAKGGGEEEKKLVTGKVLQAARFFERTVMELRGFEEKRMWVGVEVVSRKKILAGGFVIDRRSI